MSTEQVSIKARCVGCQKISELTAQQILDAEESGCAISLCCSMPMTVEKVSFSKPRKVKKKQ